MSWNTRIAGAAFLAVAAVGCDSTDFRVHPLLVTDTVTVYAPLAQNQGLPTALDITSDGAFGIVGGVFPERIAQALEWDFFVEVRGADVVLVPQRAMGIVESRAALTRRLQGLTFGELREAPGVTSFLMDSAVVMVPGSVYAARSRDIGGFFGTCIQYSKFEPLEVDVAAGSVTLHVVTNERCADPRLIPLD